jgi:hypothetical protein
MTHYTYTQKMLIMSVWKHLKEAGRLEDPGIDRTILK